MGQLTHLFIHCSDTPSTMNVTREDIERWHLEENGWSRVGYSVLIERSGRQDILVPFDSDEWIEPKELTYGARGYNGTGRHVCWVGGRKLASQGGGTEDNRTEMQNHMLEAVVKMMVMLNPTIKLIGHNQVHPEKYCPSFNVPQWAQSIGIDDRNIDFHNYAGNPFYGIGV